jgi:hypothetical protein
LRVIDRFDGQAGKVELKYFPLQENSTNHLACLFFLAVDWQKMPIINKTVSLYQFV